MEHRKVEVATSDERGQISDIFYKASLEHVAVIESKKGGLIRGNHYHKLTTQHIFITKGSLRYWYQPVDKTQPVKSVVLKEYEVVSTPPMEVHALEILEPNQFIVFSSGLRGGTDYEADTFRDIVILTKDMLEKRGG
jgi:dTDP-4-dehydrorhamnose 3,5-epimerase-like enzyme